MTIQEHRVLETAITTLHQTTGLGARVLPEIARQNGVGDATIEVETDRRKYRFAAEVKNVDRFETPAMVNARLMTAAVRVFGPFCTEDSTKTKIRKGSGYGGAM